jgi:hypothetical protein
MEPRTGADWPIGSGETRIGVPFNALNFLGSWNGRRPDG